MAMEGPPIQSSSPKWRPSTQPQIPLSTSQSKEKASARLPALGILDLDKIKKKAQEYEQKHPTAIITSAPPPAQGHPPPLASPQNVYPGPPPPYSYPSSATSSALGFPGLISPPDSRRLSDADKDQQASRQSLPSIHEALGKDQSILYSGPLATSVATHPTHSATAISPSTPIPRSHPETVLSGPPNPYASSQHPASYPSEPPDRRLNPPLRTGSSGEEQPPFASRQPLHETTPAPSHHTPTSPRPPIHSSPRAIHAPKPSNAYHPPSQPAHPVQPPQPLNSQPTYQYGPPAYSYPPTATGSTTYPQYPPSSSWRSDGYEVDRAEEVRRAASKQNSSNQPYGESVKRHLEVFELETSLNEIGDGSQQALKFANHHGVKAHQASRSGPLHALPTLAECDDLIRRQENVLSAARRIREVVVAQQHAIAEQQRSRDEANKARQSDLSDDHGSFSDKQEGGGGFAGADPKKRRGRNAPPGRCHSCNRAETPEWRRGPDGARTLCNACGLHYAKLTRKLGPKASIGSSNLRPTEAGPSP